MSRRTIVSLFFILATVVVTLVGCQTGDNPISSVQQAVSGDTATGGNARVAFNIMVSPNDVEGVQPTIRSTAKVGTTVRFTLISIRAGQSSGDTTATQTREVTVGTDGSAEVTFDGVPELPTFAQIRIEGGNIRGYQDFHGGADLISGNNMVTVNPVGSGLRGDLVARVLNDVIQNPTVVRAAPTNMCARVSLAVNSIVANASETISVEAFNTFVAQIQPAGFARLTATADAGGFGVGNATFTNTQLFTGNLPGGATVQPGQMQLAQVFRQGFGGFGLVGFAAPDNSLNTLVGFDPANTGTRYLCHAPGKITCVIFIGDGSIVAGGFHKAGGIPFVFRWMGRTNGALDANTPTTEIPAPPTGLMWVRNFLPASGISGTQQAPAIVEAIALNPERHELIITVRLGADIKIFRCNVDTGANGTGFTTAATPVFTPPPQVVISLPAQSTNVAPNSPLPIAVQAQPAAGVANAPAVTRVQLFDGANKLGDATNAGNNTWSYVWASVPAGYHMLTARAFDAAGGSRMSAAVEVFAMPTNVQRPGVAIASPSNGSVFDAGKNVTIVASVVASETVSKVEFFQGQVKLGEATAQPYAFIWTNVLPGYYMISAKATTANGGFDVSDPVGIQVNPQRPTNYVPPMVMVQQPVAGARFPTAPADVNIVVGPTPGMPIDSSTVRKIEFLRLPPPSATPVPMPAVTGTTTGTTTGTNTDPFATTQPVNIYQQTQQNTLPVGSFLIGVATAPSQINPSTQWTMTWRQAPAGNHVIVCRVFDSMGAMQELPAVPIAVGNINVPPTGVILRHEPWEPAVGGTIKILATGTDVDGQIVTVSLALDGQALGNATFNTTDNAWVWQGNLPSSALAGPHFVEAKFVDNQGAIGMAPPAMIPVGGANLTGTLTGTVTNTGTGTGTGTNVGVTPTANDLVGVWNMVGGKPVNGTGVSYTPNTAGQMSNFNFNINGTVSYVFYNVGTGNPAPYLTTVQWSDTYSWTLTGNQLRLSHGTGSGYETWALVLNNGVLTMTMVIDTDTAGRTGEQMIFMRPATGTGTGASTGTGTGAQPSTTDRAAISAVMNVYCNKIIKKYTQGSTITSADAAEMAAVLSPNFIDEGKNLSTYNTWFSTPLAEPGDCLSANITGYEFAQIDPTTWLVACQGSLFTADSPTTPKPFVGLSPYWKYSADLRTMECPTLNPSWDAYIITVVRNEGGAWKILGNQQKVDGVDVTLQFTKYLRYNSYTTELFPWVGVGSDFPISSVTIAGGFLTGVFNLTNASGTNYWNNPGMTRLETIAPNQPSNKYTVTVNFTNGTNQTYVLTQGDTSWLPLPSGVITTGPSGITFNWSLFPDATKVDNIRVHCQDKVNFQLGDIWKFRTESAALTTYTIPPGTANLPTGRQVWAHQTTNLKMGYAIHIMNDITVP